jgi:hypothetical protein
LFLCTGANQRQQSNCDKNFLHIGDF